MNFSTLSLATSTVRSMLSRIPEFYFGIFDRTIVQLGRVIAPKYIDKQGQGIKMNDTMYTVCRFRSL